MRGEKDQDCQSILNILVIVTLISQLNNGNRDAHKFKAELDSELESGPRSPCVALPGTHLLSIYSFMKHLLNFYSTTRTVLYPRET